jgi:hypothetical protein
LPMRPRECHVPIRSAGQRPGCMSSATVPRHAGLHIRRRPAAHVETDRYRQPALGALSGQNGLLNQMHFLELWVLHRSRVGGRRLRVLGLHRIKARYLKRNPVSGCVMAKLGKCHVGRLRQHTRKWDVFEHANVYGLITQEIHTYMHKQTLVRGS